MRHTAVEWKRGVFSAYDYSFFSRRTKAQNASLGNSVPKQEGG